MTGFSRVRYLFGIAQGWPGDSECEAKETSPDVANRPTIREMCTVGLPYETTGLTDC